MEDHLNQTPTQPASETEAAPETQAAPDTLTVLDTHLEGEAAAPERGRSKKWLIAGGILIIFLAAAAFLGARLLKSNAGTASGADMGPGLMIMGKGGGGAGKSVRVMMTPAPEIPQTQPSATGLFVRREDQSIFIGTGNVMMTVKKPSGGASAPGDISSKYDGPVIEVVVNHQTQVYQDITEMMPPDANTKDGSVAVEQKVKAGSLDDLGSNSLVTVWGEKQGDRYIAKVITFR